MTPKHWAVRLISFWLLPALTAFSAPHSSRLHDQRWCVWTASQMHRVGRHDPAAAQNNVELWAAGGEYESFQIIVTSVVEAVQNVDVLPSNLAGANNARIPSSAFTFYREHYVNVSRSSPDPGVGNRPLAPGWYPDALIPKPLPGPQTQGTAAIPSFPFAIEVGENQPIWVDLHVPRGAKSGRYQGAIRVTSSNGEVSVPLTLHVWPFSLPKTPTLKSSFGMHQPALLDRRVHRVLLQHAIMPVNINPAHAPELQKSLGLNTTGLRFWSGSDAQKCHMDPSPSREAFALEAAKYPADLPVYVYSADEIVNCPNLFNTVRQWAASMHSADPRIKNLVTIPPTKTLLQDGSGSTRSAVDIWVLLPKLFDSALPTIHTVQAKGDEVWSYTALVQDNYSPKWEIDFDPMNYRIMPGFLSQSLGLTGILYWRVELWTDAPWQNVYGFRVEKNEYPGEGMLVYPGAPLGLDSVVPSMRLKWIRKGVEDFEYVAILKRLGRGEWALSRIQRASADWHNWTKDEMVIESVRRELGDEIARLSTPHN